MGGRAFSSRQVLQSAAGATGDGSPMDVRGLAASVVQLIGTFTATITWEASLDGAAWVAVQAVPLATGTAATTATAAGLYRVDTRGLVALRARVSAFTSGTIDAVGYGSAEG